MVQVIKVAIAVSSTMTFTNTREPWKLKTTYQFIVDVCTSGGATLGPRGASPKKKVLKKNIVEVFFHGWFEQFDFLKNIHTFGPLKLRKPTSRQRHWKANTDHTCFWHPHLHSFRSLCLSLFLWFLYLPLMASPLSIVGLLFIFSSSLPLRLDHQWFMMFHCPRDFTLQIWDYTLQQTWVFSTFFYLRLLKNVNKTPKFLQLYSTVDQNKEINLLISTLAQLLK